MSQDLGDGGSLSRVWGTGLLYRAMGEPTQRPPCGILGRKDSWAAGILQIPRSGHRLGEGSQSLRPGSGWDPHASYAEDPIKV